MLIVSGSLYISGCYGNCCISFLFAFCCTVQPDEHSTFLYDAVVLFAIALNETIAANKNVSGTQIFRACAYKNFKGKVFFI